MKQSRRNQYSMGMDTDITTKNGLLFRGDEMIVLPEADEVARQHGFMYAERFVAYLEEKEKKLKQVV
jgi:hypothetical protein